MHVDMFDVCVEGVRHKNRHGAAALYMFSRSAYIYIYMLLLLLSIPKNL